ncbi:MAG: hypothetical protein HY564_02785, partial [Candidatus Jacksonbacteria bacterium]|nr:hypothetical protein [Candidatus Jacksonbacteria bacterium]
MKKSFIFLALLMLAAISVAPVSALAISGTIGQSCQGQSDCGSMTITPWNGPDENVALQCVSNRCVVPKQFVAIGTWCSTGIHC